METLSISAHLIHPLAIEVCKILNEHKYQAFIVGGCVRDLLLGQAPKDWDITTNASPEKVIEIFPKTIPTGLQHGTVTICMGEGVENHFEVTTFRVEGKYSDGRRPDEVLFVMNVEEDLARRDLTINAIAYDPIVHRCIDPFNGIQDLKAGVIRAVGEPTIRFQEDGLRIMRVARFAARFGYEVEDNTFEGMKMSVETLRKVSKERISDEICKILMSNHPQYGFELLEGSNVLGAVCPLIDSGYDAKPLGELETRLALLYSDHSVQDVERALINLKFSNREVKRVTFLLQLLEQFQKFMANETELAYKHFIAFVKNHSHDPWEHTLEQFIHLHGTLYSWIKEPFKKYQDITVLSRKEMQLNGNDLMEIGIAAGPKIKKILDECYSEILKNPEHNTKDYLLEMAKRL